MKNRERSTMIVVAVRHMGTMTDEDVHERVRAGVRGRFGATEWATALMDGPPVMGADDIAGKYYDTESAIAFAQKRTGIDAETCRRILFARDRFLLGMGIIADDEELFEVTAAELRARHPELFPANWVKQRYVHAKLERAFVMIDTALEEKVISSVLEADEELMRRLGLVD